MGSWSPWAITVNNSKTQNKFIIYYEAVINNPISAPTSASNLRGLLPW